MTAPSCIDHVKAAEFQLYLLYILKFSLLEM